MMLRLTPEQLRAHQERLSGRRRQPQSDPQPPQATHAKTDRWPLFLRDQIVAAGLPEPYREHCWHRTRNWRLDLAYPDRRLAIEVDGAVHRIKGRYLADIERHNALVLAHWRYIRVTPRMVQTGQALELVRELLA